MKTGVLALQGSYFDHVKSLELIDKEYTLIKSAKEASSLSEYQSSLRRRLGPERTELLLLGNREDRLCVLPSP